MLLVPTPSTNAARRQGLTASPAAESAGAVSASNRVIAAAIAAASVALALGFNSMPRDYSAATGFELVADPAHREHQLRVLRVALDLLAQVGDMDVAGPLVPVELGLP